MKFFIVVFIFFGSVLSFSKERALFSKKELKQLEYYKSDQYIQEQRLKELRNRTHKEIRMILKSMSSAEKEYIEKKYKNEFWTKFDYQTDKALRKRIILDLIFKDQSKPCIYPGFLDGLNTEREKILYKTII